MTAFFTSSCRKISVVCASNNRFLSIQKIVFLYEHGRDNILQQQQQQHGFERIWCQRLPSPLLAWKTVLYPDLRRCRDQLHWGARYRFARMEHRLIGSFSTPFPAWISLVVLVLPLTRSRFANPLSNTTARACACISQETSGADHPEDARDSSGMPSSAIMKHDIRGRRR